MSEETKQCVVVENGQRSSGIMSSQEAEQEAARRRQLAENQSSAVPATKVEVKQNIFG